MAARVLVAILVLGSVWSGRARWARGAMSSPSLQCASTQLDFDNTQVVGSQIKRQRLTYGQACGVTGQSYAHLKLPDMTTGSRRRFEQCVIDKAEDMGDEHW